MLALVGLLVYKENCLIWLNAMVEVMFVPANVTSWPCGAGLVDMFPEIDSFIAHLSGKTAGFRG